MAGQAELRAVKVYGTIEGKAEAVGSSCGQAWATTNAKLGRAAIAANYWLCGRLYKGHTWGIEAMGHKAR